MNRGDCQATVHMFTESDMSLVTKQQRQHEQSKSTVNPAIITITMILLLQSLLLLLQSYFSVETPLPSVRPSTENHQK